MNIFINSDEQRLRTLWRLLSLILINLIIAIPVGFLLTLVEVPNQISDLVQPLIFTASILLTARWIDKRSMKSIGMKVDRRWFWDFAYGTMAAGLVMSIVFGISYSADWLRVQSYGWEQNSFWLGMAYYLALMVLVGIWEELAFRGYLINNLSEGLRGSTVSTTQAVAISVIFTSVLFGAAHIFNPNSSWISSTNIMLAGLVLAVPYIFTGQLGVSVGAHFGWNFFQGGLYGFPVSGRSSKYTFQNTTETGPDTWTGGAFGPEAGLLGIIALGLLLIFFIRHARYAGHNMNVKISLKEPV